MSTQYGQNPFRPGMSSSVFNPDQLIAGVLQPVTRDVTITGGVYKRGTVMGKITTSGLYTICKKTATDGSQNPVAILVDDRDASSADVAGSVFLLGEFNANAVTFDALWTLADLTAAMDVNKVFLRDPLQAPVIP
ncbi:head decoration protein [Saezia sanguinis]|uniref:head decoration protein n=1 Tax=Saezia sanguinis TaxID=1965230 RepID=UPI003051493C